jgi:hypothetical protein
MIRYISVLSFSLITYLSVYSQKVDTDSTLFKIKIVVNDFFIKQGLLDKSLRGDTIYNTFAYEIVEKKVIGYNRNGIYRIGVFQSHTNQHILIKENDSIKIFDLKDLDLLLRELLDYRIRYDIEMRKMLPYFLEIIELYKYQYK